VGVLNSRCAFEFLQRTCTTLGDEEKGGRVRFFREYLLNLPVPNGERENVGALAKEAQRLHTQRRKRVEKFLFGIGLSPAASSSRNPLEEPWKMTEEQFARRVGGLPQRLFAEARDETAALTEQILKIEREIDERMAALYGVPLPEKSTP